MSWFKRTPHEVLAADIRCKADEFNRAVGKAKSAGLEVYAWGRSLCGNQLFYVIDKVDIEAVNRKKF